MRNARLELPSIKRFLVNLNQDLDHIYASPVTYFCENEAISNIEKMVLLLEDRRYFRHKGVDLCFQLQENYFDCAFFMKHGGASTIDMQFVRTITNFKERTLRRKFYEMVLARVIQYHFTKRQIIKAYLEVAYFGTYITGVGSASSALYRKDINLLDLQQTAFIAAMLVYPRPSSPSDLWNKKVTRRANYALKLYPSYKKIFEKLP